MRASWVPSLRSQTTEEELPRTTTSSIPRRKNCGRSEVSTSCRTTRCTPSDPQSSTSINTLIRYSLRVSSPRWQCRPPTSYLMYSSTNTSCRGFHRRPCRIITRWPREGPPQWSKMCHWSRTKWAIYLKCKRKLSIIIYLRGHSVL
jgi:hypothetical protein